MMVLYYREAEIYATIFEGGLQSLTQNNMYNMLDTFEKYNLSISAEQVLDIVWKMSMPLLHTIIDSHYPIFLPAEPERLRDWRNLVCHPLRNSFGNIVDRIILYAVPSSNSRNIGKATS
jgi:hypothetical protein